ncbi:response regulator transcription factor [Thiobacter aerophilum]|uniref:Response regulator transcription factor n=1 Tax=Thiobacter aerophilum TaxID=3121275 RepID=A0ABV0EFL9_9BURK
MHEGSRDLLLVDDDDTLRRVLSRALGRRGFCVRSASSGEEALAMARADPPAYAVVDLKMTGMSGLALVPQLRALRTDMRILVLTGYASIATAVEAIKLGATHYLAKPADPNEIIAALGRASGDPALPVAAEPLSVDRLEWEHIQKVLAEHDGNISATARALKMHRRTLQRKLAKKPVPR